MPDAPDNVVRFNSCFNATGTIEEVHSEKRRIKNIVVVAEMDDGTYKTAFSKMLKKDLFYMVELLHSDVRKEID